jgi:hypothetical protein
MNRMRSMALPALLALSGLGLCGPKAAAQYVGGGTAYAPGYYYAPGPGYYGSGYYDAPRPAAGPYYYAAPIVPVLGRGRRRVGRLELSRPRPLRPPRALAQLRPGA